MPLEDLAMRLGVKSAKIYLDVFPHDSNGIRMRIVPLPFIATPTPQTIIVSMKAENEERSRIRAIQFLEHAESTIKQLDMFSVAWDGMLTRAT
jgi:hypothetical protein